MAYAKADLRNDVAYELGVVAIGIAPSAEDAARIDGKIDSSQAELLEKEVAYWDIADIPDEIRQPFIEFVAARAASQFPASRIRVTEADALAKLQSLTAKPAHNGEPVKAIYY